MNKLLFTLLLIISVGLYIFNVDHHLTKKFVFINNIKSFYVEKVELLNETLEMYFFQAQTIEDFQKKNAELQKYEALHTKYQTINEEISKSLKNIKKYEDNMQFSRVLSYLEFDDFTKVWLDQDKTDSQIDGLVFENYAAGIVVNKDDKAMALLNGNEKSNYAVYIGKNKAPGITHSLTNSNELLVKYIPIWINIKIGDEVITSGMDNIFFQGLKVGKVASIKKFADMQEAKVEPYVNALNKNYFYIYSKTLDTTTK